MGACRRRLRSDLDLAALLFNEGIIDEIRQILSIRAPFLKTGRYWHLGCRWGTGSGASSDSKTQARSC